MVLLGFLASDEDVGYFSSAYKLIAIIMALGITPITQTLYPHLGSVFSDVSKDKEEKSYTLLRVALAMTGITLAISIGTFAAAPIAVLILFGKNFSPAIASLRLMSFLPLIIGLSNVFGIQGMLNLKLDKEFFGVTAVGAVLCMALNFFLIPHYSQLGTTGAWVLTEIFITTATFAVLSYHGYAIFTKKNIARAIESLYV
jgi:PST family polysaccharide transporter